MTIVSSVSRVYMSFAALSSAQAAPFKVKYITCSAPSYGTKAPASQSQKKKSVFSLNKVCEKKKESTLIHPAFKALIKLLSKITVCDSIYCFYTAYFLLRSLETCMCSWVEITSRVWCHSLSAITLIHLGQRKWFAAILTLTVNM